MVAAVVAAEVDVAAAVGDKYILFDNCDDNCDSGIMPEFFVFSGRRALSTC